MHEACPVCGGKLEAEGGAVDFLYSGDTVRFCGLPCLRIFQQFPEVYAPGADEAETATPLLEDSKA